MPKLHTLLPALALAATLQAQLTPLQDPANLAGERVSPQDPADTLPLNHGAPALQQLLAKLRTRASLMLIVAHPDDEDGGLLTYESRGQGARVAMLTLTRGEGGQNLMSADFDDALGLIRTQELLAADRYFGVNQFFGTEVDFGFSKTKEESFAKWTHERVLYDAVRAVRLYRPLVIASVFVGGATDGHGQHQVSGEIAQEVFLAAADPKVFPEMGLPVWAPLKVYARVPFSRVSPEGMYDYATGKTVPTRFHNYITGQDSTTEPTATVLIHEGDTPTNPTLAAAMSGDSYVQFARKGLALQKTQIGPNVRLAPPGRSDTGYTLMASRTSTEGQGFSPAKPGGTSHQDTIEQSLFEGIDTSLPGIATLAPASPLPLRTSLEAIDSKIAEAQTAFNPTNLQASANPLREALSKLDALISVLDASPSGETNDKYNISHELHIKRVQLNNALALALGETYNRKLELQADSVSPGHVVPGQYIYIKGFSENARTQDLQVLSVRNVTAPGVFDGIAMVAHMAEVRHVSSDAPLTRPYFSRRSTEQPFYDIANSSLRNAPATPPSIVEELRVAYKTTPLTLVTAVLGSGVASSSSDEVAPAQVLPEVSISVFPSVGIISTSTGKSRNFSLHVLCSSLVKEAKGSVHLELPSGWRSSPETAPLEMASVGADKTLTFQVLPSGNPSLDSFQVIAIANINGKEYREGFRPVGYPGLPYTNFYTPATYRATAVDLTTAPNLRIAYLPGTGDTVPDFLPNLGVTPTILTLKDLTPANLRQYDAVLLGVRAYAAHPELAGPGSQPLLDYAKAGGVVILQYMTARYGDAEAPFPITVPGDSAHNVVEESQPVAILRPDNPLLTWPNKITSADFNNWVAERGHGFAATWSPSYTPLLETHDLGQDPQQGGLLLARTGKGAYIYCALALYRQLPEGVPGAYRLLANLLSYAKNPQLREVKAAPQ